MSVEKRMTFAAGSVMRRDDDGVVSAFEVLRSAF